MISRWAVTAASGPQLPWLRWRDQFTCKESLTKREQYFGRTHASEDYVLVWVDDRKKVVLGGEQQYQRGGHTHVRVIQKSSAPSAPHLSLQPRLQPRQLAQVVAR